MIRKNGGSVLVERIKPYDEDTRGNFPMGAVHFDRVDSVAGGSRCVAVNRMNPAIPSVFDLSPSEKLQLVEDLWDDLAASQVFHKLEFLLGGFCIVRK